MEPAEPAEATPPRWVRNPEFEIWSVEDALRHLEPHIEGVFVLLRGEEVLVVNRVDDVRDDLVYQLRQPRMADPFVPDCIAIKRFVPLREATDPTATLVSRIIEAEKFSKEYKPKFIG